jgi:uncharacterized protein YbjT (DUF2867 family)
LTQELVQKGHDITVVSSKPERKGEIEAMGAKAAIGTIEDHGFLSATFQGADTVFILIAPSGAYTDPQLDVDKKFRQIGETCVEAIETSGVKRVVYLSSIGADLETGSGLLRFHHAMEALLDRLRQVAITFVRPTGFYNNLYGYLQMIKTQGVIAANYGEEDKVEWVSPSDIATVVAEELEALLAGGAQAGARKVRYAASDELTCSQMAWILGEAIGKPDLKWVIIPGERMKEGLVAAGLKPFIADGMVEMYASRHSGRLSEDYYRNRPVLGRVKMTDFAKEFTAAYNRT